MHISIEGMDGVGKSTLALLLSKEIGFEVVEKPLHLLFDKEGETLTYEKYRDYINNQTENHGLRALFYGLGNAVLQHTYASRNVISVRHLASNYYWCGNETTECLFDYLVKHIGKPELTIVLFASRDEIEKRIIKRSSTDPDLEKLKLHQRVKEKMVSFLIRYEMKHIVIDTTSLGTEQLLSLVIEHLTKLKII